MIKNTRRQTARLLVGVAATALAMTGGACGGGSIARSSREALSPAPNGSGESLLGGRRGGTLTVYQHTDFATLDPGEEYSTIDQEVVIATQRPLFSYLPNQTETLSPDLASAPAIISSDGRTVTVHIRHGIHFSPPVDREVTSADVAYAIERGANPHVANPYFAVYYDYILGARNATGGSIPGIATPDKYTIVFHLTGPYGALFAGALSLPLTAPVPKEFAAPLDNKAPTAYGSNYLVATGPYMVKADARGKTLDIGYRPGESVTLVRNPNWSPETDSRPAYLDRIRINIGGDANVIGREVLQGSDAIENDTLAQAIVKLAYEHYHDQMVAAPGAGIYYVAVNNKHGPFSNINVRKALWAALDRQGMIDASGGPVTGTLATHFIYPGTPGYAQADGSTGPPADYNTAPSGNMALATKYMKAAGYPTGRYNGHRTLTIAGVTGDPYAPVAELVNQTLSNLGFKTSLHLFSQAIIFSKFCGTPAQEIDVCPNGGWTRDFADPQTILDPLFAGYHIIPTGNPNIGQVDDPQLNKAMKAAEQLIGLSARARAWAQIDRMVVHIAAAIPWEFANNPTIESHDVRGINDLWNGGSWDYAYTSLK